MTAKRLTRERPRPQLKHEFEINFKLTVVGPGITEEEARAYVEECMRYASAAFLFEVAHPVGERDGHKRDRLSRSGEVQHVSAS